MWASLILAWGWWYIPLPFLPGAPVLILGSVGFIVGLILGFKGRGDVKASGYGLILANIAIASNLFKLGWTLIAYASR